MKNKKIAIIFALLVSAPMIGQAESRIEQNQDLSARARLEVVKDQSAFQELIADSAEAYRSILNGDNKAIPSTVLKNARCIAVLPNVITGAVVVGGTFGEGLASCKNNNGSWSQPTAIALSQGSIGLQAGGKSADMVMYFQSKEAVSALKKGEFTIGTDISAVAGTYDNTKDTSGAGVVVYSRSEGAFAGVSITGSKIANNQKALDSYYGRKVEYAALIEGRDTPDSVGVTKKLTSLFP
jgi:lipid-binding SYLF domain-containing protein